MAQAVAQVIQDGGALVAEAGTGVGKTFAYLVPALLSGQRLLVSTATKALQDQLFLRDLPRVQAALGVPVRAALLKGRSSYLCLERLERACRGVPGQLLDPQWLRALARVQQWARGTRSGDLDELPGLDEATPVLPLITSTRDNCLGAACPHASTCHVNRARADALAADVVVVNHHLFFADLALRTAGVAELLPRARVVVFDEAHQLCDTGLQFTGLQVGTGALRAFARDALAEGLAQARGLAPWLPLATALEDAVRGLRQAAGVQPEGARLPWQEALPQGVPASAWHQAMQCLGQACASLVAALGMLQDKAPALAQLHVRGTGLMQRMAHFAVPGVPGAVRWLDVGTQLRFVESPPDIADTMRALMQPVAGTPATAWIFTSATLGGDATLRWFTGPCGVEDARILRVESPFDYARQAALYVPPDMPPPSSSAAHSQAVAALAGDAALRLGGRTMVLTTTRRALHAIGAALQERLAGQGLTVLVQGQQPRHLLLQRLRQGGAVLVGAGSFWEGVDVPGDALQLLVIDKLPFAPPDDPLAQARAQRLEAAGRSAFREHALPEAAVALQQGAGRLIRHEADRGVLVVCDTRLRTMGYGKRLRAALPPMQWLASEAEFAQALQGLGSG
ncbi:ATP-dependent DNA helicase DinG [Paenacidovorax caeni]|uniref:ATP-dependent DNA helicase DinG n=2 Tax=Paenacidovorax caeni TaxID=343013 RepID=A0A1I7HSP2_9BURK|nr:ATP-dependent DNA helicase DinG [Paenacidovorax caeni]